jgi:type VI secretion system secreted protein VgrG
VQDDEQDVVVLTDNSAGFQPISGQATANVRTDGQRFDVFKLEYNTLAMPKAWRVHDYNHRMPLLNVNGTYQAPAGTSGGVVEFGPNVKTPLEVQGLAKQRADERTSLSRYYAGSSDISTFSAGRTVMLEGVDGLPTSPVMLVEVEHHLTQSTVTEVSSQPAKGDYYNTFRAVDNSATYRPPRITPRPHIDGVLQATVEPIAPMTNGPTTVDPRIDQNGEYTIRLHFDPAPPGSRSRSSLPVRMMQSLAGPNYGIHFPLRGGVEVFVLFVDGDPDRPLIAAAVHNGIVPHTVTSGNNLSSKIQTQSGICVTMKDTG